MEKVFKIKKSGETLFHLQHMLMAQAEYRLFPKRVI